MGRSWGKVRLVFSHLGFIKIILNMVLKGLQGAGEKPTNKQKKPQKTSFCDWTQP